MSELMDFSGKTALVTGGAGGIGMATCRTIAQLGGDLVLADRDAGRLEAGLAELKAQFPQRAIYTVTGDIGAKDGPDAMFAEALAQAGQIDVLVNNAGVGEPVVRTVDQDIDDWQQVMDINLRGAFLMARAMGRHVLGKNPSGKSNPDKNPSGQRRPAAIVNIASVAGMLGVPGSNAYAVSKAAVIHLTRTLASEWAGRGLRVNAIAPGYIETSLAFDMFEKVGVDRERLEHRLPMRRMGRPEEIASAVAFLASGAGSYVNGVVLPVDGGWMGFGGP